MVTTATRSQGRCFDGDDAGEEEEKAWRLRIRPTDLQRGNGELNRDKVRAEVLGFMGSLEREGIGRVISSYARSVIAEKIWGAQGR